MPAPQANNPRPAWPAVVTAGVVGGAVALLLAKVISMAAKTVREAIPVFKAYFDQHAAADATVKAENESLKTENADLKAKLDAAVAENADQEAAVGELVALIPTDGATPAEPPADPATA